ncbi:MAG: alpha/beta fold hydrolase [Isosphaeraceae bacterium]
MNTSVDVTLIAGWAQTDQALAPLAESLRTGSSGVVPDFRSVSLTSTASLLGEAKAGACLAADESPSAYTVALASRLRRGEQPATLIGWSMGGMIALETAVHFPELVDRLVLVSSCAVFSPPAEDRGATPTLPVRALVVGLHRDRRETLRKFFALVYSETGDSMRIKEDLNQAMNIEPEALFHGLRTLQRFDLCPRLSAVNVPTLLIHGRQDQVISFRASQLLVDGIVASTLLPVDEGDHGLPVTSPELVAAAVARFLSGDQLPV